ncbi:transposase family protein [Streptomyces sp. NPDC096153]|uniref:transposase family protein n=1 Tax=Streptomyces sp. NPDC096153 TaxID=3155548 RepID=UPI0033242648
MPWPVVQERLTGQILVLADRAYREAGATVRTPTTDAICPSSTRGSTGNHAQLRAPGEQAFARLEQWRILRKARRSPNRISRTVAAVHAIETAWRSG